MHLKSQPGTPLTTRYVYDGNTTTSESHLRFVIDADGRVTEHRYSGSGQRTATLNYLSALYTAHQLRRERPRNLERSGGQQGAARACRLCL